MAIDVSDLHKLFGPPRRPPSRIDWGAVEGRLGRSLPDDYKALTQAYPALRINDFLNVFHPVSRTREYRLLDYGLTLTESARSIALKFPKYRPLPYYPSPGGLLCWGCTDNGDKCYWRTNDARWTIVVGDEDRWSFDGDVTDFVVEFFIGHLECPVFPHFSPGEVRQVLELD